MKWKNKKRWVLCAAGLALLAGMIIFFIRDNYFTDSITQESENVFLSEDEKEELWKTASTTPLGKYPELVTYTLGKVTAKNNSNMPEGDTYEDNNHTRYIRSLLNVQNQDVMEGQDHNQYERVELMAVLEGKIPDIMVVTSQEVLDTLVEGVCAPIQ